MSLTVHEAAVKRIVTLEVQIKTATSDNHSLVNKFKDLERKVATMEHKVSNRKGNGGGD